MGFTALHMLPWLLTASTLTTQEFAKLVVSPNITVECGKQVTLNCNVASPTNELSVKHMGWIHNNHPICSVDSEGHIKPPHVNTTRDFHCEYKHGQLSLIFQKVKPLKSGHPNVYLCKLRSNQGVLHKYTTLHFQECCGSCSSKSAGSGRHISRTLVHNALVRGPTDLVRNGGGSQGPMRTFLCISILLAVTLK